MQWEDHARNWRVAPACRSGENQRASEDPAWPKINERRKGREWSDQLNVNQIVTPDLPVIKTLKGFPANSVRPSPAVAVKSLPGGPPVARPRVLPPRSSPRLLPASSLCLEPAGHTRHLHVVVPSAWSAFPQIPPCLTSQHFRCWLKWHFSKALPGCSSGKAEPPSCPVSFLYFTFSLQTLFPLTSYMWLTYSVCFLYLLLECSCVTYQKRLPALSLAVFPMPWPVPSMSWLFW